MPKVNDALGNLIAWVKAQSFTPAIREVSVSGLLPPANYPQLAVLPQEERFSPRGSDVTLELRLRITEASGRPADALTTARSLAHQLRSTLHRSHNLGGTVLHLATGSITYSEAGGEGNAPATTASATLELELKYIQQD